MNPPVVPITPATPFDELPQYLTVKQFCAFLHISRNVAYAAIKSGQLPSRTFAGRSIRIPRSALLQGIGEGAGVTNAASS